MLGAALVALLATAGAAQQAPLKPAKVIPGSVVPYGARFALVQGGWERLGVWDLSKRRQIALIDLPAVPKKDGPDGGQQTVSDPVAISPDGRWVVVESKEQHWHAQTPSGDGLDSRPSLLLVSVPDSKVVATINAGKGPCDREFSLMAECPVFFDAQVSPDGMKLFYTLESEPRTVRGPGAHKGPFGWEGLTSTHHETVALADRSGRVSFKLEIDVEWKNQEGAVAAHYAYQPAKPAFGFVSDGRPALVYSDFAGCAVKGIDGKQWALLDDCTGARQPKFQQGKIVSAAGPVRVWDPLTGNLLGKSERVLDDKKLVLSADLTALVELDVPPVQWAAFPPFSTATARVTDLASGKVLLERVIESPDPKFAPSLLHYDRAEGRLDVYGDSTLVLYDLGAVAQAAPAALSETASAVDIDAPPAAAQAAPDPDAYAVVIGIEKYRQDGIPAVDFASHDASTMYGYLTRAMGYDPRNVLLLTDEKATKNDLEKNLGPWLRNRVDAKSRVFVYYAGHGAPNPASGEGYLMPYDGDPAYVEDTAFPISKLYADLGKLPAKDVTVVLDACFSGQGGRSLLAKGARPLVATKSLPASANAAVLAAASGGQISASDPERRHGLLTGYLLEALHGAADARGDGKITGDEVYAYVRPAVERAARLQNVEQTPTFTAPQSASRPWVVLAPKKP